MKKLFGVTLALFAAFAIVYVAFRPVPETAAISDDVATAAAVEEETVSQTTDPSNRATESQSAMSTASATTSSPAGAAQAKAKEPCTDAQAVSTRSQTWLDHFKEGQGSYSKGEYAKACRAFDRAVAENDDNFYLHYMLGLSYWKDGRLERAASPLNRSLELKPDFVNGWVNLARVRRELGDPQEAVALCEKAIVLDDSCDDAWNVAGLAHLDTGDGEKAINCFKEAIVINSENAFALNNLGLTYIYEGRFEEALLPLQQAAKIAPEVAFILNNLGVVYERLGRAADAARRYAEAVDTASGHAKAEESLKRVLPLLSVEEEANLAEFYQVER